MEDGKTSGVTLQTEWHLVFQKKTKTLLLYQLMHTINTYQPVVLACGEPHASTTG
jgi:hypothetical protein